MELEWRLQINLPYLAFMLLLRAAIGCECFITHPSTLMLSFILFINKQVKNVNIFE